MTEYTSKERFQFEGGEAWRDPDSHYPVKVSTDDDDELITDTVARTIHAFIEAERTGWHWTNADRTEARNGRWVAFRFEQANGWRVTHEDFGQPRPFCMAFDGDVDEDNSFADAFASRVLGEFHAWRAEQDVPDEPTGLGAVVEVEGRKYVLAPVGLVDECPWLDPSDEYWSSWSDLTTRGPVTILSEGVTS